MAALAVVARIPFKLECRTNIDMCGGRFQEGNSPPMRDDPVNSRTLAPVFVLEGGRCCRLRRRRCPAGGDTGVVGLEGRQVEMERWKP